MIAKISSLLFATNLSKECRPALETAVNIANNHQAELVLLYIIVKESPEFIEEDLKRTIGAEKWETIRKEYKNDVEKSLTGKMSVGGIGRLALQKYCEENGINLDNCKFNWRSEIVTNTDRTKEIIRRAKEHNCGMIILGNGKGLLGGNALGSTIKSVLKKSEIPVLVVPSSYES